jgi:peroxiredoxin (alkyl hydroperoxide reductase subunit C)
MVRVGEAAPDFTMEGIKGKEFTTVTLSDYMGKWVVLFFYPLDFTFVCPTEITEFTRKYKEFAELNAEVFAVSVDSKYSHLAWVEHDILEQAYPLLSDITKDVSRSYDMLMEDRGFALRGTFIIDPEGIVRWMVVHDPDIGRNVDETLRVLQALQTGHLCPVNWKPGDETLGKAA